MLVPTVPFSEIRPFRNQGKMYTLTGCDLGHYNFLKSYMLSKSVKMK